jgi:hypothetical protein
VEVVANGAENSSSNSSSRPIRLAAADAFGAQL